MADVSARVDYEYKVSGTEQASQGMEGMATSGAVAAAAFVALTAAVAAAAKELYDFTAETAVTNAALYNNAAAANISVEEYQGLNYVLRQTTGQVDGAGRSLRAINTFLLSAGEGSKRYTDVLDNLNLTYEDLVRMDPTERYLTITDAIGQLSDATEQNLAATAIFGNRYATQVVGALNQSEGSMRTMIETFEESNMVIGTDSVTGLKAYDDSMTDLQMTVDNLKAEFAAGLAPSLDEINDAMKELLPMLAEELADALPTLQAIAERIADDALRYGPTVITIIGKIIDIVAIATEHFDKLETAARFASGPVGIAIHLVEMLGDKSLETYRKTEWFHEGMGLLTDGIMEFERELPPAIQYTADLSEQVLKLTDYTKDLTREQSAAVMSIVELTRAEIMRSSILKGGLTPGMREHLAQLDEYVLRIKETTRTIQETQSGAGAGGGFSGGDMGSFGKPDSSYKIDYKAIAEAELVAMEAIDQKNETFFQNQMRREEQILAARMQAITGVADRSIDIIVGGFTGGFDNVLDGFKDMIAQMATEYLKSQIFRLLLGGGKGALTGGAGFFL